MQKLSIASVLCLGSLINAVEIYTQDKFLGLPIKMTPAVDSADSINPTDQELFTSSYPCTFKLGNGIYDFTPFKLATNSTPLPALWYNITGVNFTDPDNPELIGEFYSWNFTWCEYLSEASPVPNNESCKGEYFVAGSNSLTYP